MSRTMTDIRQGLLLGAASGLLSQSALATVLVRTPPERLPGVAGNRWVRRAVVAGAAGEALANAFVSSLPPRTDPTARNGRIVMAALSAGLVTHRPDRSGIPGALTAAAVAPMTAWAGTTIRGRLAGIVPDPLIALAETGVAFGLAALATK